MSTYLPIISDVSFGHWSKCLLQTMLRLSPSWWRTIDVTSTHSCWIRPWEKTFVILQLSYNKMIESRLACKCVPPVTSILAPTSAFETSTATAYPNPRRVESGAAGTTFPPSFVDRKSIVEHVSLPTTATVRCAMNTFVRTVSTPGIMVIVKNVTAFYVWKIFLRTNPLSFATNVQESSVEVAYNREKSGWKRLTTDSQSHCVTSARAITSRDNYPAQTWWNETS
jgi:hypothetical protein